MQEYQHVFHHNQRPWNTQVWHTEASVFSWNKDVFHRYPWIDINVFSVENNDTTVGLHFHYSTQGQIFCHNHRSFSSKIVKASKSWNAVPQYVPSFSTILCFLSADKMPEAASNWVSRWVLPEIQSLSCSGTVYMSDSWRSFFNPNKSRGRLWRKRTNTGRICNMSLTLNGHANGWLIFFSQFKLLRKCTFLWTICVWLQ